MAQQEAFLGKVLCGYQGWFRCPGDGVTPPDSWVHWMKRSKTGEREPAVEMWPDLSEFGNDERFPYPGYTHKDGKPAYLFSSTHPRTVQRHFEWMRQYGIDGVMVQRFQSGIDDTSFRSYDHVLPHIRRSARATGRVWCLEYDMSSGKEADLLDRLIRDWDKLSQKQQITGDPGYLYQDGKPVLALWGFFAERFSGALAHRILDHFLPRAYVIGGVNWPWRGEKNPSWYRALRRFDAVSPWNVGHTARGADGILRAATLTWEEDRKEAEKHGMAYLPVLYPGFRWNNLKNLPPDTVGIPRRRGEFLREQFAAADTMRLNTLKVAMFDEVDEATAIMKVTNDPPTQVPFLTLEGLPTDAYLRLVGEETRRVHHRHRRAV